MNRKNIAITKNTQGGIDYVTRRGAGIPAPIPTGNAEDSLQYWKEMKLASEEAIAELERAKKVHVVILNTTSKLGAKVGRQFKRDKTYKGVRTIVQY